MTDTGPIDQRLDSLEIRITYQDQLIEDLNTVVSRQAHEIEQLRRNLARLEHEVAEAEQGARTGPAREPPPPHY